MNSYIVEIANSLDSNQAPRLLIKRMLNSAEHDILNAHKYKDIKIFCIFQAQISFQQTTLKGIISQTDYYLVSLSSKTYVF